MRVESKARHDAVVFNDLAREATAPKEHGVGLVDKLERLLCVSTNTVHRLNGLGRSSNLGLPSVESYSIENVRRHEGIDFVESLECHDGYAHGIPPRGSSLGFNSAHDPTGHLLAASRSAGPGASDRDGG
jgi:hypothetical protein